MITRKIIFWFLAVLAFAVSACGQETLSKQQLESILQSADEAFRTANSKADSAERTELYNQAILSYRKIIDEGRIHNAKLYYNLANAYFLNDRLGYAILNYRRAERLDGSDANIKKNLVFAQSRRADSFEIKTQTRIMHTLFFWHYDFSLKTRFVLTLIFFASSCIFATAMLWMGRRNYFTTLMVIFTILFLCFLCSVLITEVYSSKTVYGVIISPQVIARQGDGQNYPPSFKQPLHEGTEFEMLEQRPGWLHIKLPDNSDAWIPQSSAEII